MSNRYVTVERRPSELRVPRGVTARQAIEAILAHMGMRLEVTDFIPAGKVVEVVPVEEAKP